MPTSDTEQALRQTLWIISEAEIRLQHALHELSLMKETLFLAMRSSSSSSRPIETPIPQLHWDLDSTEQHYRRLSTHVLETYLKDVPPYLYW